MYSYWGFGLNIASEILLPGLAESTGSIPELNIRICTTPDTLYGDEVVRGIGFCITTCEYLLTVEGVARYYAVNGETIAIEPAANSDDNSVRLFLFCNAMTAIIYQRNWLPLRATAILYKQGVALFCGGPNSGKSTLIAALMNKGYTFFSDEPCLFKEWHDTATQLKVLPSGPLLTVWEDSFEKAGLIKTAKAMQLRPFLPKYALSFLHQFNTAPQRINLVFILERSTIVSELVINELSQKEAFWEFSKSAHHPVQLNAMNKTADMFKLSSALASVKTVRITRPYHDNTVNELAKVVAKYL